MAHISGQRHPSEFTSLQDVEQQAASGTASILDVTRYELFQAGRVDASGNPVTETNQQEGGNMLWVVTLPDGRKIRIVRIPPHRPVFVRERLSA